MKVLNRYWPIVVPALAILLTVGSLRVGWCLDDYYQRWVIRGSPGYADVGKKPLDAFCFIDGDPGRNGRLIEQGLLPWWVDTRAKAAFWKPLTVLTHMLDYRLWPDRPGLMHAQSVFWFALLVGSVCMLFRQVMRPTLAAAIAGLLYAVDHSRAVPVAWLANRNSVLAALFGVLAIHAHLVARRKGSRAAVFLSPVLLAVCLLSAEADQRTLLVRPDVGYFPLPPSRLGYNRDDPFTVGRVIALPSMTITIMEMTGDDRLASVQFRFAAALDDASLQWVYWESGGFYEFRPPAVGEAVTIAASGLPF